MMERTPGMIVDGDRATIYGALLELVGKARSGTVDDTLALRKRRDGAFDSEAEGSKTDA
ncbi:conjugal transfer protein TraD [Sphingomonas sp. Leaf242]|uniref:conjugal transfer protein TraD n=1 Tax=Sphingomonas sp. Leaf242 TaxID=1736304 RepID=UPI000B203FA1|nr:conjugal transfer protein TraD [Sphingomonas sp. Leaf242]